MAVGVLLLTEDDLLESAEYYYCPSNKTFTLLNE